MRILSNAHTHTKFCDGQNTPEEMALAAIDRGFISLGFSIHGWTPYEFAGLSPENEQKYRDEVHRVAEKYKDQIEILCGIECDCAYDRAYEGFDYRIDSTHYLPFGGEYVAIDSGEERADAAVRRLFGGDYYAYCRAYYDRVIDVLGRSTADFIGHIDLVTKYNEGFRHFDENDPRYLSRARDAIACAAERDLVLEINTGAISRGHRTMPYPALPLLKLFHDLGGRITINSDAHFASAIDCAFDLALERARACGYTEILRMRRGGFEEIGI